MILFAAGLILGKWLTGSWLLAVILGVACSMFIGDDDKD